MPVWCRVAGIHVGTIVHIAVAMIGLSAVLTTSASAFAAVKLAGAVYLIWLGMNALRSRRRGLDMSSPAADPIERSLGEIFRGGVMLSILNPKTAVFFLSFVPQFVDPAATTPTLSLAALGAVFIALGLLTDGATPSPAAPTSPSAPPQQLAPPALGSDGNLSG